MKTRMLPALLTLTALALAACGKEAPKATTPPPAPAAASKEESRPMPPSAPTAAPAEGEKKTEQKK